MARSKYDLSSGSDTEVDPNAAAPSFMQGDRYDPDREAAPGTAPAPQSKPSSSSSAAAKRRTILSTIMGVESGGRNIPQGIVDINTAKGTPAQGYFQIIDPTWAAYGGNR